MATDVYAAIRNRRTVYTLGREWTITEAEIEELLRGAVMHSPTAFNSQSGRVVLLLGQTQEELWEATREVLSPLIPREALAKTDEGRGVFNAAYKTVLLFEDQVPETWKLAAERPFGTSTSLPEAKDFLPVEDGFLIPH